MAAVSLSATAQTKSIAYLFIDLTAEELIQEHKDKATDAVYQLIKAAGIKKDHKGYFVGNNGIEIQFLSITDKTLTPNKPRAINIPINTDSDLTAAGRNKQIKAALAKIPNAMADFQFNGGYGQTLILENLTREIRLLKRKKASQKYILFFSDMIQNSDKVSFYPPPTIPDFEGLVLKDVSDIQFYGIRSIELDLPEALTLAAEDFWYAIIPDIWIDSRFELIN